LLPQDTRKSAVKAQAVSHLQFSLGTPILDRIHTVSNKLAFWIAAI
jgi:hypothetical protein